MNRIHTCCCLMVLGMLLLLSSSCQDPCKNVACVEGFCVEGRCYCDDGYSGPDCTVPFNQKFTGTYLATEICDSSGTHAYPVTITAVSGKPKQAAIKGLYRIPQASLVAEIQDDGLSFFIPYTDVGLGSIEDTDTSTANLDGSTIHVFFKYIDEGTDGVDSCTAVLTRQ